MANLKRGSKGDEVKDLQTLLNEIGGYNLAVDGSFGPKTLEAVRDYQSKNGLTVDGIAGINTMTALRNASASKNAAAGGEVPGNAATQAPEPTPQQQAINTINQLNYTPVAPTTLPDYISAYETGRPEYSQDPAVAEALARLQEHQANKPGEYVGTYDQQIQQILDNINNRGEFNYDFNVDPLYQQYRQQYINQGQQAMMDTMGNAAALSGGYGNSYAQTAGQQAYNAYLGQLNNVIPQLYETAYNRYQNDLNKDLNLLGAYQNLEQAAYGRYRDTVNDYQNELQFFYNQYTDMSDRDYQRYLNDADAWERDRAYWYGKAQDELAQNNWQNQFAYQQAQDNLAQSNWEKQFAYQQQQDEQAQANWEQEYALQLAKLMAAGGGGGGGSRPGGNDPPQSYDEWYKEALAKATSYFNGEPYATNGKGKYGGVDTAIAALKMYYPSITADDQASIINTILQQSSPSSKSATGGLMDTPLYKAAQEAATAEYIRKQQEEARKKKYNSGAASPISQYLLP